MKLRVLSPAASEVAEAAAWYDTQRRGLGLEFWRAVDATLLQVSENPTRFGKSEFANAELEYRLAIVKRFRYVVHFVVINDEVEVTAVSHPSRRPGYWLKRDE